MKYEKIRVLQSDCRGIARDGLYPIEGMARDIVVRANGSLAGLAFYLYCPPEGYNWQIVMDELECFCLVLIKE